MLSFPGPEQSSRSPSRPRRARIAAIPRSGRNARNNTNPSRSPPLISTFVSQYIP